MFGAGMILGRTASAQAAQAAACLTDMAGVGEQEYNAQRQAYAFQRFVGNQSYHILSASTNLTPCPYCKRTNQTPGRQSCDGCGAPR